MTPEALAMTPIDHRKSFSSSRSKMNCHFKYEQNPSLGSAPPDGLNNDFGTGETNGDVRVDWPSHSLITSHQRCSITTTNLVDRASSSNEYDRVHKPAQRLKSSPVFDFCLPRKTKHRSSSFEIVPHLSFQRLRKWSDRIRQSENQTKYRMSSLNHHYTFLGHKPAFTIDTDLYSLLRPLVSLHLPHGIKKQKYHIFNITTQQDPEEFLDLTSRDEIASSQLDSDWKRISKSEECRNIAGNEEGKSHSSKDELTYRLLEIIENDCTERGGRVQKGRKYNEGVLHENHNKLNECNCGQLEEPQQKSGCENHDHQMLLYHKGWRSSISLPPKTSVPREPSMFTPQHKNQNIRPYMTFPSVDGEEIYFVGIIDFITPYDFKRYFHTAW